MHHTLSFHTYRILSSFICLGWTGIAALCWWYSFLSFVKGSGIYMPMKNDSKYLKTGKWVCVPDGYNLVTLWWSRFPAEEKFIICNWNGTWNYLSLFYLYHLEYDGLVTKNLLILIINLLIPRHGWLSPQSATYRAILSPDTIVFIWLIFSENG